jgi:thiazole synthase
VKIEIIADHRYLMPDNHETLLACRTLAKEGFTVLPYISPDPVTALKLEEAGAAAVMPLGAPIGSNSGLQSAGMIRVIRNLVEIPVIVDAGIGQPSHAALAMETGADAVLVNTAISTARDPVRAARAFALAVEAGRLSRLASLREESAEANPSSPLTGFLQLEGARL